MIKQSKQDLDRKSDFFMDGDENYEKWSKNEWIHWKIVLINEKSTKNCDTMSSNLHDHQAHVNVTCVFV